MKSFFKFLSRNKLYASIEAVGLAVSLAFVILIGSYAWQQWAVTRENPDWKNINTFNLPDYPGLTFGFAEKLSDAVPEVVQTDRYCPEIQTYVHVEDSDVETRVIAVDPSFFQLFPYYGFLEGTPESLATKEDVLLSESFARAYHFKVGDVLHTRDWDFSVAGIVDDFRQTLFPYVDIIAHPDSWLNSEAREDPFDRYGSMVTFARVVHRTDRATLQAKAEAVCKECYPDFYDSSFFESLSVERLYEIFFKQEKEKKRQEEEKHKAQSEKDKAEKKAQEAKKAVEEKDDAEKKTPEAKTALSSAELKITEKQTEIDNLENRITSKEAVLDRLITETRDLHFAKYSDKSAGSDGWKDSLMVGFSNQMIATDETVSYCIHAIQDYAYSGFMCSGGGKHDCIFWPEEAHAIKKVMRSFAEAFKTTLHSIGEWLVWMANKLGNFSDRELYRANKEVKDIADGYYDGQIRKVENGYGGGMSR